MLGFTRYAGTLRHLTPTTIHLRCHQSELIEQNKPITYARIDKIYLLLYWLSDCQFRRVLPLYPVQTKSLLILLFTFLFFFFLHFSPTHFDKGVPEQDALQPATRTEDGVANFCTAFCQRISGCTLNRLAWVYVTWRKVLLEDVIRLTRLSERCEMRRKDLCACLLSLNACEESEIFLWNLLLHMFWLSITARHCVLKSLTIGWIMVSFDALRLV